MKLNKLFKIELIQDDSEIFVFSIKMLNKIDLFRSYLARFRPIQQTTI